MHGDFDNFFNLFIGSISIILELYVNDYNFFVIVRGKMQIFFDSK